MYHAYIHFPRIDPVFFSLGPISIRWYGTAYLLGFLFALSLANRRADRESSWTRQEVSDLLFHGFIGAILGGRTGYVLFYGLEYLIQDRLYIFKIWTGGMSFHGGLLGVIIALFFFSRKSGRSFLSITDFVAPLVPFGLGLGRLGNFVNGELWGRTTDVSWAIIFPRAGYLPRHPSQLYEMLLEGIVLCYVLNTFIQRPKPIGATSGLFLLGYGVVRFFVEFFREPDSQLGFLLGVVSMGQVLSLPMIGAGCAVLFFSYQNSGRREVSQCRTKST